MEFLALINMALLLVLIILVLHIQNSLSYLHVNQLSGLRLRHLNAKKASTKEKSHDKSENVVEVDSNPRTEALAGVLHQIERNYGKGSIIKLGETSSLDIARTSSGSYTLDLALGGGYPRGRVIEIYGPESSGKTTLALHAIAEVQKKGGTAAFIDAEHALDPVYSKSLGVNTDELLISQPDSGEMALDIVDQLVRSSAVDIIVVDSVAALAPRAELEGDMADMQVGLQARLMSKALRKITGSLNKSQTTVIFLNQLRSKVGIMYGSPEITSGGNALKFYSSVRLDIRRKELLGTNDGILAKIKVVKNKVFPPFKVVELEILFGSGVNKLGCLIDAAEVLELVERKGSWYNYGEIKLGQGRRQAIDLLTKDSGILKTLEDAVKIKLIEKCKISVILEPGLENHNFDASEFPEAANSEVPDF